MEYSYFPWMTDINHSLMIIDESNHPKCIIKRLISAFKKEPSKLFIAYVSSLWMLKALFSHSPKEIYADPFRTRASSNLVIKINGRKKKPWTENLPPLSLCLMSGVHIDAKTFHRRARYFISQWKVSTMQQIFLCHLHIRLDQRRVTYYADYAINMIPNAIGENAPTLHLIAF